MHFYILPLFCQLFFSISNQKKSCKSSTKNNHILFIYINHIFYTFYIRAFILLKYLRHVKIASIMTFQHEFPKNKKCLNHNTTTITLGIFFLSFLFRVQSVIIYHVNCHIFLVFFNPKQFLFFSFMSLMFFLNLQI